MIVKGELIFVDRWGRVWQVTPDNPEPRLVRPVASDELDLTDADREMLADLKVTA